MRNKFSLAMTLAVIVAMLVTSLALADQIGADTDDLVLLAPHANSVTATQNGGTTVDYNFSAVINNTGNAANDVFRSGHPEDTVNVTITRSGNWANGGTANSFTFTGYGTGQAGTIKITVPCGAEGTTTTMTVQLVAGASSNGQSLNPNTQTLSYVITAGSNDSNCVPQDTTPPTIGYTLTPASPDGSNSWYKSNVTLVWNVADSESSVTKTGCVDQNITSDQAATAYLCSATSAGGSAGPVSVSIQRDATAPGITWSGSINDGDSFVYGSVPAVPTCSATDSLSGPDTCSVTGYGNAAGSYTLTATATDKAGNTKQETRSYTVAKANATCSITGYNVTYDGAAHTATGSCTGVGSEGTLSGLDLSGTTHTNAGSYNDSWTFTDSTGNYNNDSDSVTDTINKATLTVTADNKSIYFGNPDPTFTFQYAGFVNGETASVIDTPPTCSVSGTHTAVGTYSIVCSNGVDNNYSFSYVNGTLTIVAWTPGGFYQPVDMGATVVNTVKNGSTVPLKFEIFAGSTELTNISYVTMSAVKVSCTSAIEDPVPADLLNTGSTSLRYDDVAGQFIFNWKTPKSPNTCYKVTATFSDGSAITAAFKLK